MPVLPKPKHERFAQELAQGKTEVEAHEIAGYSPNDGNASKLATKPEIQDRVKEITGNAAMRAEVTVVSLIQELNDAAVLAKECKQPATLVAVVKEKGILSRLRVERAERGEPGAFDKVKEMNGSELAAFIARRSEARRLRGNASADGGRAGGTGEQPKEVRKDGVATV